VIEQDYIVRIKKYQPTDPRLGRHVRHDSRSLSFPVEAEPLNSLKSIRHISHFPTLNQKNVGACTAFAGVKCLSYDTFWSSPAIQKVLSLSETMDDQYAMTAYSDVTKIDPYPGTYPPTDTGSDGLSVAKLFLSRKLISGYQHATSLEAALTALAKQPVIVGTTWKYDMFRPDPLDGKMKISGSDQGGHEYVLDELDVERRRVWLQNSWADVWGIHGRAYMTWDELGELLDDDGDCTVFISSSQPAPTPIPPTPPSPQPAPVVDLKAVFQSDVVFEINKVLQSFQNKLG